ncbi:MAG: HIT family protein [Prevotella sp.]|jgi:histidine triad (HIT) family protein|nr:HIT family protein [Prevotella sp.]MCH3970589.1 HIT family protein [Prevotella sp.]MCI1416788.1 HIT family protein [Prevotella sp.]MCI1685975.1 HIT family protein [Prevotella sp.]MCI1781770.1 HIT family protein [Prevotella sp.]MCI1802876.1 HIT family protein [Prevotella sp.]
MSTLFSKIAAGEIPSYKCAEDEKFYAFLDINPVAVGHTLVIPRKETDYLFDMDDWELAEFEVFAKKVAHALRAAYPCKKVAEIVLGLEVPHAHIQLIPLNKEADINMIKKIKLTEDQFKEISNNIYTEFKKQNPHSFDR